MAVQPAETAEDVREDVRDFSRRFARLVISRAFREAGGSAEEVSRSGVNRRRGSDRPSTLSLLPFSTVEAELSLRGSQRLAAQLLDDADTLYSQVLPSLRENARLMHALFNAIDRMTEVVMPEIEEAVNRMEHAVSDLEEMRKEQVDTRGPLGSYGLGLSLGAGFWPPRESASEVVIPEVLDTKTLFPVNREGLVPL